MCDETTDAENTTYLANLKLNRRQVGVAAAALVSGCATNAVPAPTPHSAPTTPATGPTSEPASTARPIAHDAPPTKNRMVTIETPDGQAEAFFVTPVTGKHPGVILWPDIAGVRAAYRTMATRLAQAGYAVLAVNQYYRSSKLPLFETITEWREKGGMDKVRPMMALMTPEAIASDGAKFAGWLDAQTEVDTAKKLATIGYCMGGPFTIRTAVAAPERIGVIGSFHGGSLVTDKPDSPHLLLGKTKVAALICIAESDDKRQPEAKGSLRAAASEAKLTADIEVYPAQHGWCAIDAPVYDEAQAEKAWSKMLAMFKQHL